MAELCADSIPDLKDASNYCAPQWVFGEIEHVIIAPLELEDGTDPFPENWESEDHWNELLSPAEGEPVAFKVPVRGTLDEPDRPEVEASLYRKAHPPKRHNVPATVDDLSDKMYNGIMSMQNKRVRFWFLSGGKLLGYPQGIKADTDSWLQIEEGEDSMHRVHLNFNWRSSKPLDRVNSPFEEVESV